MTDRNQSLIALAARCEKATGPSVLLDAQIFHDGLGLPLPKGNEPYCPRYTASLDAAMTLVPEGWWIDAQFGENRSEVKSGRNGEWRPDRNTIGYAAAPALALCAAALRARAAQ